MVLRDTSVTVLRETSVMVLCDTGVMRNTSVMVLAV